MRKLRSKEEVKWLSRIHRLFLLLSCIRLCNPWIAIRQVSLSLATPLRVCSNSCPLSQWCDTAISSSVTHFSSCSQTLPASGSFPMSHLFASGDQSIGASASASVLPLNIQDWFPLGLTGLISLLPKRLLGVIASTTVWKHQFFGTQPHLEFSHSNTKSKVSYMQDKTATEKNDARPSLDKDNCS